MNATKKKRIAGVESSGVLALVFNTAIKKRRLSAVLGCQMAEIHKKLSGERGNPLRLSEKILVLALELDRECGTAHARKIAEHLLNVYRRLVDVVDAHEGDWRADANSLLREGTDAICRLNLLESDERDLEDLLGADSEMAELQHKVRQVRARVRSRIEFLIREGKSSVTGVNLQVAKNHEGRLVSIKEQRPS